MKNMLSWFTNNEVAIDTQEIECKDDLSTTVDATWMLIVLSEKLIFFARYLRMDCELVS